VLLSHTFDETEGFEVGVFEVTSAVHLTNLGVLCETTFCRSNVSGLDLAAEESTCERVVNDNVDLVLSATGNELRFDCPSYLKISSWPCVLKRG
jgi:hypothetical protein